jgi:hypothetical protein
MLINKPIEPLIRPLIRSGEADQRDGPITRAALPFKLFYLLFFFVTLGPKVRFRVQKSLNPEPDLPNPFSVVQSGVQ